MLGSFHSENNKDNNNISTSQETQRVLIGETINGENPATSSKIVTPQDVKPQNSKMHSQQQ